MRPPGLTDDDVVRLSPAAPLNAKLRDAWPKDTQVYLSGYSACCRRVTDRICRLGEDDVWVCRGCGELCDALPTDPHDWA